jgi:perosamine synthetase
VIDNSEFEVEDTEVPIVEPGDGRVPLFMPHIPKMAGRYVMDTLNSRWIGQGPKVESFENRFSQEIAGGTSSLAVGSGTDALHLAYLLAGVLPGDEVIVPVFTCTATNIPLLYIGATPVFADIDSSTMNISPESIRSKVSNKTRAIVVVHYGGLPCDMDEIRNVAMEFGIPVIEDAAHAVGAEYKGTPIGSVSEYTIFSFQAIKHITTADGGMLMIKDKDKLALGQSLRWFGIDRPKKQQGIWKNDITEIGYKYQMTDVSAAMGLAALDEWPETFRLRQKLLATYMSELGQCNDVKILGCPKVDRVHAAWMFTIAVDRRKDLQSLLLANGVETNQVHYRNDRYSIFGGRRNDLPLMDAIEDDYLVLPLHTHMSVGDVQRISQLIRSGW